jgi:hypothetical protein
MNSKEYIFAVLVVIFGGVVGFFWEGIPAMPALSVLVVVYAILFGLYLVFARQALLRYTIPPISFGAIALFLGLNKFVLEGLGIAIVFVLIAAWSSEREYKNSIVFSPQRIIGRSLKLFFTGLAVLFAFTYYGDTYQNTNSINQLFPRSVFQISLKAVEGPLKGVIPGFSADSTIDEILISVAANQGGVKESPAAMAQLQTLVKRNRAQMLRELEGQLGVDLQVSAITGGEKVSDILYGLSMAKTEEYVRAYIGYLPLIVAISYFFALKAVSIVVYLVVLACMALALRALLWFGMAHKDTTMVPKEVIY